jgi:hypothetical protein
MKLVLAVVFLCAFSSAQSLPDAPSTSKKPANIWLSPFRDPSFYAGTAIHITGVAVDVNFVQHCEKIHTCFEANQGADRWSHRIPEIALGTLARYGCSLMLHDHKYWRLICLVPSVAIATYDIVDGTKIHYEARPR